MNHNSGGIDAVDTGIIWSRIVSTAEEMVSALVRTAFSTMVRESGDYSCMIFDSRAKLLAQGTTSVPSFTGTGPHTLGHVLKYIPATDLKDGDVIITNDPWIGTGHTYDINVIKPVFYRNRLVGYCLTVSHLSDVGGVGMGSVAKDVYEEGFSLPPVKLFEAGVENKFIVEFIRNNVRTVDFVLGDIYSNVASCNVGAHGLIKVLTEYDQLDTVLISDAIYTLTRRSIAAKLSVLPKGVHHGKMLVEGGVDYPDVTLAVTVAIRETGFEFDFDGTDPVVGAGVNVPICYTRAFCYFCAKVLVAPDIPNNQAVLDFVAIRAPDNCVLNALRPHPTGARHIFGHAVGPLIFGTLAGALPDEVQADSGMVFQVNLRGQTRAGRRYSSIYFSPGGYGALAGYEGRAALPAPSNMISGSIEVWEQQTSCTFLQKEILPNTGGAGEFQGGNGQIIRLRNDSGLPIEASFMASRTKLAARGFAGGEKGSLRVIRVQGEVIDPKARKLVSDGDIIEVEDAGGGGFGDPRRRDTARVAADLANGLITDEYAEKYYPTQMTELRKVAVQPVSEPILT